MSEADRSAELTHVIGDGKTVEFVAPQRVNFRFEFLRKGQGVFAFLSFFDRQTLKKRSRNGLAQLDALSPGATAR